MKFGSKMRMGLITKKFIEKRVAILRKAKPKEGLEQLKTEVHNLFGGHHEKLRNDPFFPQIFLRSKSSLRKEPATLGSTLLGAFTILDQVYTERLVERKTKQK